jgi:FdrA protein
VRDLLAGPPRVISVGLELFATTLVSLQVPALHVDWRPPGDGDPRLAGLLAELSDDYAAPGKPDH